MIRLLVPDVFTDPAALELDEYSSLGTLWPAYEVTKSLVREGRPVFRANEAPAALAGQVRLAIDPASADAALLELVGSDPLVDRLIAARPRLSRPLVRALVARHDAGVAAWLAGHVTTLDQLGGAAGLTVTIAERLVANPETPERTLAEIAGVDEVATRRTLAQREDLPAALLGRLARDPDADLRASVFSHYDNAARLRAARPGTARQRRKPRRAGGDRRRAAAVGDRPPARGGLEPRGAPGARHRASPSRSTAPFRRSARRTAKRSPRCFSPPPASRARKTTSWRRRCSWRCRPPARSSCTARPAAGSPSPTSPAPPAASS